MTRRTRLLAGLVVAAATLAAGCGGEPEPELYSLEPTQACLDEQGVEVSTDELDFVASTAAGGAFQAEFDQNEVTVSFGENEEQAERTAQAYRNFAGPGIPIDHVLFRQANAVLVWGAPPAEEERLRVQGCLSG